MMGLCLGGCRAVVLGCRDASVTTPGGQVVRDRLARTVVSTTLDCPFEIGRASDLLVIRNQCRAADGIDRDLLDTSDTA